MTTAKYYLSLGALALGQIGMVPLLFSDAYQQAAAQEASGYAALAALVQGAPAGVLTASGAEAAI